MIRFFVILFLSCLPFRGSGQQYNAELKRYNTDIRVKNNQLQTEVSYLFQINNKSGTSFAEFSIPFSKEDKIKITKAEIWDMNNRLVRKLKKKDIKILSAVSNISLYEDDFVQTFDLVHGNFPYQIILEYKRVDKNFLTIANWTPVYNTDIPTHQATLNVSFPQNLHVLTYDKLIPNKQKKNNEGLTTLHYQCSYDQVYNEEILSPLVFNVLPQVKIAPMNFNYNINGSFASWNSFGKWVYHLNKNQDKLPEEERKKIIALTKDLPTKKEKIKEVYNYFKENTRYIGVQIGTGKFKPYPASYVAANKYGDCKALTNYMQSLLRCINIESYYALIYSGYKPSAIDPKFPFQEFNHAILYIPLENDTLWLENTDNTCPFNYLGITTQDRPALIVDEHNSKLVRTPALSMNNVHNEKFYHINIDYLLTSNVKYQAIYRGIGYSRLKYIHHNLNAHQKDKVLKDQLYIQTENDSEIELNLTHRDVPEIELTSYLYLNNLAEDYGKFVVVKLPDFPLPPFEKPEDRKLPLFISFPIYETDSIVIDLPNTFDLDVDLNNVHLESTYGECVVKYTKTENSVTIKRNYMLFKNSIPVKEYPEFHEFHSLCLNILKKQKLMFNKLDN